MPRSPRFQTLGDVLAGLGDIPPGRVHFRPYPGTATRRHLLRTDGRTLGTCELVDGTIVEKPANHARAYLVAELGFHLVGYAHATRSGYATGPGDWIGFGPELVRSPDVAFCRWLPGAPEVVGLESIGDEAPVLAVDYLVPGITRAELARKHRDYFGGGVKLAWVVDIERRTVEVFSAPGGCVVLDESGTLDGGDLLPGFRLAVADVFGQLDR